MKRNGFAGLFVAGILGVAGVAGGTPSTTYWTPAVMDVQPYGVGHIGIDNYFTVDRTAASGDQGAFPTDLGFSIGVLPYEAVQLEIGVDALYPSDAPYYLNAKLGTPENSLFAGSPALNAGIFNVGFKKDVANFNIFDLIVGKTLPWDLGRLHAGGYIGNRKALVSSDGEPKESGVMVGYDRSLIKDKLVLAADYASGKNAIGGGGVGLYYFFTKDISLLAGPVWFNNRAINGDTKWTAQLDINLPPVFGK